MADARITDYTKTTVTSGTTIDPADENTNRTNIATSVNNSNDVLIDLESNYASGSEPTSVVTGKLWYDTTLITAKTKLASAWAAIPHVDTTIAVSFANTFKVTAAASTFLSVSVGAALQVVSAFAMAEIATPAADAGYGKVYPKTDDNLYFQDGAGVEHPLMPRNTVSWWHTFNDYGTTGIKVPKYTTEVLASDGVVATMPISGGVDSQAAHGFTIKAVLDCWVDLTYSVQFTGATWLGATFNTSDPAQNISDTATSGRVIANYVAAANVNGAVSARVRLSAGDILRPQTDGAAKGSGTARCSLYVCATEII